MEFIKVLGHNIKRFTIQNLVLSTSILKYLFKTFIFVRISVGDKNLMINQWTSLEKSDTKGQLIIISQRWTFCLEWLPHSNCTLTCVSNFLQFLGVGKVFFGWSFLLHLNYWEGSLYFFLRMNPNDALVIILLNRYMIVNSSVTFTKFKI